MLQLDGFLISSTLNIRHPTTILCSFGSFKTKFRTAKIVTAPHSPILNRHKFLLCSANAPIEEFVNLVQSCSEISCSLGQLHASCISDLSVSNVQQSAVNLVNSVQFRANSTIEASFILQQCSKPICCKFVEHLARASIPMSVISSHPQNERYFNFGQCSAIEIIASSVITEHLTKVIFSSPPFAKANVRKTSGVNLRQLSRFRHFKVEQYTAISSRTRF